MPIAMSLTLTTVSNTTATVTLTSSQVPSQSVSGMNQFIHDTLSYGKGFTDDSGTFYPASAVLKVVPTLTVS